MGTQTHKCRLSGCSWRQYWKMQLCLNLQEHHCAIHRWNFCLMQCKSPKNHGEPICTVALYHFLWHSQSLLNRHAYAASTHFLLYLTVRVCDHWSPLCTLTKRIRKFMLLSSHDQGTFSSQWLFIRSGTGSRPHPRLEKPSSSLICIKFRPFFGCKLSLPYNFTSKAFFFFFGGKKTEERKKTLEN